MRKFFAVLVFMMILSGTSRADLIYTTDNGKLGTIVMTSVSDINAPAVKYTGAVRTVDMGRPDGQLCDKIF